MGEDVIVIAGPTACGKTSFSIELAKKIDGEIVGCDSMQIYKEMDIGTAKVTKDEMQNIPHHLIDIIEPTENFSVAKFQKMAMETISQIISRGKVPIVVGGTGQYMDSIIYETRFLEIETDFEYRKELEQICDRQGLDTLYEKAVAIDPQACLKISPNDKKRIFRLLEIYHQTGKTKTQVEEMSHPKQLKYNYHVYVLNMQREALYDRINKRVDIMLENGLVEEVKNFYNKYQDEQNGLKTSVQAIGYKEVKMYLDGLITYPEMVEKVKQASRNYAKRQITWFKKDKNNIFLDAQDETSVNIEKILKGMTFGK